MNSLLASMIIFAVAQSAIAQYCATYEAQVIGEVSRVEQHRRAENLDCHIYLGFDLTKGDLFNMHQMCPLTIDEAMAYPLYVANCEPGNYPVGQRVDGILVRQEGADILTLE